MSNFIRPTLPEIQTRIGIDLEVIAGINPTQYNTIIEGIRQAVAGVSHGLHGHLDFLATQYHPFTASGLSLQQFAALYGITANPAQAAGGVVTFNGANGAVLPAGALWQSRYGVEYTTDTEVTISGTSASASLTAVTTGAIGNLLAGEVLSLLSPIDGINSNLTLTGDGLTGGAEAEDDDNLQARYFRRVRKPIQGGSRSDYVSWALEYPGITRAWDVPLLMGDGTVTVFFTMDATYADGIPLLSDAAALFNYIDPLRPAGMSGLFVTPPVAAPLNPQIALSPNTTAVQAAIIAQLTSLIRDQAAPENGTGSGTVLLSHIREAISTALGEFDHDLISPSANVTPPIGAIVTLGTPIFTAL